MILGKKIGAAVLSFALVLSLLVLPAGAAGEIGVTIDGKNPKDFQKDLKAGVYDDVLGH